MHNGAWQRNPHRKTVLSALSSNADRAQFVFASIYQLPVSLTILTVASEVLTAKLCLLSEVFRLGRAIINACTFVFIVLAIIGILLTIRKLRGPLKRLHLVKKFFVLKGMIIVVTLEYLVIEAAVERSHMVGKKQLNFYDWYLGVPAVIVACEMPVFAG
jgi:hypothetical protein